MVTIKDVAKLANVSVTSTSYALNGTGTISKSTRKRVLEAAETLNYHPNAFARNLKNRRSYTIGVFITSFGGSFFDEILEGIRDAIKKTEYELIVCPETRSIRKILTQRQVDGAIIFDRKIKSEIILKLASDRFPIVVMDRQLDADFVLPLLMDNDRGTREAFYHLYDQGARRITCIWGVDDSFDNHERKQVFLEEAQKNNISLQTYTGNFTEISGYEIGKIILADEILPEAVFCANDQMAIGLIKAIKEHKLRVPEDIAVVGFDDILVASVMQPTLSTVGISRFLWGTLAVSQLVDFLKDEKPFQTQRIPTRLIQRESSRMSNNQQEGNA